MKKTYLETTIKVFLSTVWDLYFYLKFDAKEKLMPADFLKQIKLHLSFFFDSDEDFPEIREPIKELYGHFQNIENYYYCPQKEAFVEKYYKDYSK